MASNPTKPIPIPEPPIMVSFSFACSLFPVWLKCPVCTLRSRPTGSTALCRSSFRLIRSSARAFVRGGPEQRADLAGGGGPGSRASKQFLALVTLLTMKETLSLAEVKAHFSALVGRVNSQHDRVTVTVHGHPSAVLLSVDDLDALEETIAILSDTDTMGQLAASDAELARGEGETEQSLAEAMRRRGLPRER